MYATGLENIYSIRRTVLRKSSTLKNFYNLTLIWILFTSTAPFVFYLAIPNHPYKFLVAAGIVIIALSCLLRMKINTGDPVIVSIIMIQICYSFVAALLHELFFLGFETLYINMAMQFVAVLIVYLYINSFFSIHKVAKSTVYVMGIMGIMGALAFVLSAMGLLGVMSEFKHLDDSEGLNFILTFSKGALFFRDAVFIRVAGFFDEPGTFAYFITFALLTNRLYDYSGKLEWMLILTGLFTFSLAFYITLVFYFILYYGRIMYFNRLFIVILSVFTIGWYVAAYSEKSDINNMIYYQTIGRLQIEQSGSDKIIAGDNRSDLFVDSWHAFSKSPVIGHGFSAQKNPQSEYYGVFLGANLLTPLVIHGVLGTTIIFAQYFYFSYLVLFRRKNIYRYSFAAWAIVTLNLFQRPDIFGGLYGYLVVIILIEVCKSRLAIISGTLRSPWFDSGQ